MDIKHPTRAGQAVQDIATGKIGITTDEMMKRTPRIGVIFLGHNYSVLCQIEELRVVEIEVAS